MNAPTHAREFAVEVVRKLRDAGFDALWAGGCVRDQLLGRRPKDYDVATNAHPDEIRRVFGDRRTLAIGAAFGVITVVGRKSQGQIEVATFRQDATYSDGRHPDSVKFSTAAEDAKRRDFTINGLFFDPTQDEVIDYVGGRDDLQRRIVRAIGDPFERIDEDKLRMLRAVRFAATFDFQLEPQTQLAVQQQASQISVVSAERITAEMRRMLTHRNRTVAIDLLRTTGLLVQILPELTNRTNDDWATTIDVMSQLAAASFPVTFAGLIFIDIDSAQAEQVCRKWRMPNDETQQVGWMLSRLNEVGSARSLPWPRLQRLLTAPRIDELLELAAAVERVRNGETAEADYCREKLRLPPDQLDPPALISGNDLIAAGIKPGPEFRQLLYAVRDAQLEGHIATTTEAVRLARTLSGIE